MKNTTNTTTKSKLDIISEIENIGFAIEQGASIAISVHGALFSDREGEDYLSALHLSSNLLKEQREKLSDLMGEIYKLDM